MPMQKKLDQGIDSVKSFYSSHTSIAFCSAVFLSKIYSDIYPESRFRYIVLGAGLAAAATTGYMRYAAEKEVVLLYLCVFSRV
jgi:hypothetical protein